MTSGPLMATDCAQIISYLSVLITVSKGVSENVSALGRLQTAGSYH